MASPYTAFRQFSTYKMRIGRGPGGRPRDSRPEGPVPRPLRARGWRGPRRARTIGVGGAKSRRGAGEAEKS